MHNGSWLWSEEHRQLCLVIETQTLWGDNFHRVWLPTQDTVVRIPADKLKPLTEAGLTSPARDCLHRRCCPCRRRPYQRCTASPD